MKRSIIVLISGGIILLGGLIVLGIVAQSAISEMRNKEYTLGPRETVEIRERIEGEEYFSGVYAIEIIEQGDSVLRIEIKDPDDIQIISRQFDAPFVIDNFDAKKEGLYTMTIHNSSPRDMIRISAALGGDVYSGSTDPMIAIGMPSYIVILGMILLVAGGISYLMEKRYKERGNWRT